MRHSYINMEIQNNKKQKKNFLREIHSSFSNTEKKLQHTVYTFEKKLIF